MVKLDTIRPGSYATIAEAKEGGGASEAVWGEITGTMSNQTDLMNALNAKQRTLVAGENITITEEGVISASGDIGAEWGTIGGNLEDQADLKEALDAKQDAGDYATEDYVDEAVAIVDQEVDDLTEDVTELTEGVTAIESRVGTAEDAIEALGADVDALETRMGTAESDVTGLGTRLNTAESDILVLDGDMDNVMSRMDTAEGDIDALETLVAGKQNVLTAGTNISIVGDVISATGGGADNTFVAIYGTTSFNDIKTAYEAGKVIVAYREDVSKMYVLNSYDIASFKFGCAESYSLYTIQCSSSNVWSGYVNTPLGSGSIVQNLTSTSTGTILSTAGTKTALDAKQDAPATVGTEGQVLGLNEDLEPEWIDVGGGGGGNYVTLDTVQDITAPKHLTGASADNFKEYMRFKFAYRPSDYIKLTSYNDTLVFGSQYLDGFDQTKGCKIIRTTNGAGETRVCAFAQDYRSFPITLGDGNEGWDEKGICAPVIWVKSLMKPATFTADGSSSYTVAHSLGKMPSIVQVTDTNGVVLKDNEITITKTTTNVTVAFETAPESGTYTVGMLY